MSFGDDISRQFTDVLASLLLLVIIFVPLGLWKLIEICFWVFNHVHIGLK